MAVLTPSSQLIRREGDEEGVGRRKSGPVHGWSSVAVVTTMSLHAQRVTHLPPFSQVEQKKAERELEGMFG